MSSKILKSAFCTWVFLAGVAFATTSNAADAVYQDDPAPVPQEIFSRSILIGGGAGFEPRYEGSDEYRVLPFPIISYNSGEPGPRLFEYRSLDDIRFHALRFDNFSVGSIAGYTFGRDEDDSNRLRGFGDIDGGLVLGGFASYEFYNSGDVIWGADIGVRTQVTGDAFDQDRFAGIALPASVRNSLDDGSYGYEVDLGLSGKYNVNEQFNIAMRLGAVYASDDYMQTHFSVSTAQAIAANSLGNPINTFAAVSGIKNVYFRVNTTYELTENIQLRARVGYSHLLSDAADSPVTESANQFSGTVGAAYRIRF